VDNERRASPDNGRTDASHGGSNGA
jgi:hypothetical protein